MKKQWSKESDLLMMKCQRSRSPIIENIAEMCVTLLKKKASEIRIIVDGEVRINILVVQLQGRLDQ